MECREGVGKGCCRACSGEMQGDWEEGMLVTLRVLGTWAENQVPDLPDRERCRRNVRALGISHQPWPSSFWTGCFLTARRLKNALLNPRPTSFAESSACPPDASPNKTMTLVDLLIWAQRRNTSESTFWAGRR